MNTLSLVMVVVCTVAAVDSAHHGRPWHAFLNGLAAGLNAGLLLVAL